MKYLVAGLGNIGPEYVNTRHNIGFKVLDSLAGKSGIFFSSERYGEIASLKYKGRTLILLKPNTFMNLSGKAVNYWMQKEKINSENLLVVTDDIALPFGKIRLKGKGSAGGHNGLKSINEALASTDFARLRFGVGDHFNKGQQVNYVLSNWNMDEVKSLNSRIEIAEETILSFCTIGLVQTMSTFNNK